MRETEFQTSPATQELVITPPTPGQRLLGSLIHLLSSMDHARARAGIGSLVVLHLLHLQSDHLIQAFWLIHVTPSSRFN